MNANTLLVLAVVAAVAVAEDSNETATRFAARSTTGENALAWARAQIGKPYCYGGTGPSCFDCSGLVMKAYAAAGVSIPRTSGTQCQSGQWHSGSDCSLGDIICISGSSTNDHVALYAGYRNGNHYMVESPRPGKNVREVTVWATIQSCRRF
eukprot:m51a1_g8384 hypothetical protein (152) ;mRNA; f:196761-197300